MADIRIFTHTTTDDIRRRLSDFSRFSRVEASIARIGNEKVIVLHEVTLGQRLGRLFQSTRQRNESEVNSRRAMNELAASRPAIRQLLGASINHKSEWSANALHKALAARIERMTDVEGGEGITVPLQQSCQLGIANARVADIHADHHVLWRTGPAVCRIGEGNLRGQEIAVVYPMHPNDDQMRSAYEIALSSASGHVVIEPISDIDIFGETGAIAEDSRAYFSDRSLNLLLESIDKARQHPSGLTAVTIATGHPMGKGLAGRIEDLEAARKAKADDHSITSERGRFYPPHGRLVPGLAGIHFLANSPFDLQAGRTIVPQSVAIAQAYDYIDEQTGADLPGLDRGRLIAFDDLTPDQSARADTKNLQRRFSKLLSNMAGTVVISPPGADDKQLEAIMSAVLDACERNSRLSVSFATSDKEQQARLTWAFRHASQDRHQHRTDSDEDDESEIPVAKIWQTV